MECCSAKGCDRFFSERVARRDLRRYRRKGLDATAEWIVGFLRGEGIEGQTVLEVGGGVGALQVELLKAGAERAVNVELPPSYEQAAQELAHEAGLEARVERLLLDFAQAPDKVAVADIVVLHRVVCCYPDFDALLTAAADRTRRLLVFSYPPRHAAWRLVAGAENLGLRLLGSEFRGHLHPPGAMLAVPARHGLRLVVKREGRLWHVAGLTAAGGAPRPNDHPVA